MKLIMYAVLGCALSISVAAEGSGALPERVTQAFARAGLPLMREKRRPAPVTLKALDGTTISLDRLKGKVVFLNFWATWCPPCRDEMPSMEALYQRLRGKGFELVACDIMEDAARVRQFMQKNNLTFPVALDNAGGVSSEYGIQGIPATFIIDRDGMIILRLTGSRNWNTPEIIAAFEALLDYERPGN